MGRLRRGNKVPGTLVESLSWMPHGGSVYVAWAELTGLYNAGTTPVPDAHAALQQAAAAWLERQGPPSGPFIEEWLGHTSEVIKRLVARDGDFWRP